MTNVKGKPQIKLTSKTAIILCALCLSAPLREAYAGAKEAEAKREADVIDDYTLALIEEGVL